MMLTTSLIETRLRLMTIAAAATAQALRRRPAVSRNAASCRGD